MNEKTVEVGLAELPINSVIAEDVINQDGFLLAAKDTMVNSSIIDKLNQNEVSEILIKEANCSYNYAKAPAHKLLHTTVQISKSQGFKQFKSQCSAQTAEIRKHIIDISQGRAIDLQELYKITDNLINLMNPQSNLFAYMDFMKTSDYYTFSHSLNVSLLCNLFGRWLGLSYENLVSLTVAGLLHDLGKTKIDPKILNKPGKLTDQEFRIIKKHTIWGYEMLAFQDISNEIKDAVLMHHEKIDGSGYPLGISGNQISQYAKIVAICDIYDAMTADRIYRNKVSPFEVIRAFEQNLYGRMDKDYLLMFLKNIAYTHISSQVHLSDGRHGEIVFINSHDLSRPVIKTEKGFIDLSNERDIQIAKVN